jgi:uncharacterized protein YciI
MQRERSEVLHRANIF